MFVPRALGVSFNIPEKLVYTRFVNMFKNVSKH